MKTTRWISAVLLAGFMGAGVEAIAGTDYSTEQNFTYTMGPGQTLTATAQPLGGYEDRSVWVDGSWRWQDGYWSWRDGYWSWQDGYWYLQQDWYWQDGYWYGRYDSYWQDGYWYGQYDWYWQSGYWYWSEGYWYFYDGYWYWQSGYWIWYDGYWYSVYNWYWQEGYWYSVYNWYWQPGYWYSVYNWYWQGGYWYWTEGYWNWTNGYWYWTDGYWTTESVFSPGDWDMQLLNPTGAVVTGSAGGGAGGTESITYTVPAGGPYGSWTVRVYRFSGPGGYNYGGSVTPPPMQTIEYFLGPGQSLSAVLDPSSTGDWDIRLREPSAPGVLGVIVAKSDRGAGLTDSILYTVPLDGPSGTWKVDIFPK